jgi:hypothetical protein
LTRALALTLVAFAAGSGCSGAPVTVVTPPPPDMALPHRLPTDHGPLWGLATGAGVGTMVQPAPEVYVVVWPNDTYATRIGPFVSWLLGSDFWTGALKEYGVGKGTNMGVITMPSPSPAQLTVADLNTIIKTLTSNGSVPSPNANTNIAFFIPGSTKVTAGGLTSCVDILGFHDYMAGPPDIVYSVINECVPEDGTVFDTITKAGSHELGEAATDPIPGRGFIGPQTDTEVGDLCNFAQDISYDVAADAMNPARRYTVQRMYSFATAKLNNADPCLPVPYPRPFFNVTTKPAVLPLSVPSPAPTTPFTLETLLEPFAYGDVGAIHWAVIGSQFDVQPASGTVMPGDTVRLEITVPGNVPLSNIYEIDIQVESEKAGSNTWPFFIDACPKVGPCNI